MDVPVGQAAGTSGSRERWWRVAGGLLVGLVAIGSLFVPRLLEDSSIGELWGVVPDRALFMQRTMTGIDYYFLGSIGLGLVFLEAAVLAIRRSRYPRTDGAGAALVGMVLCALGGSILFVRLWIVVH